MPAKYQLTKIVGFGLQATMDDSDIVITDQIASKEIVRVPANKHPRVAHQFEHVLRAHSGANHLTKMSIILECLASIPEMQSYL